MSEKHGDSKGRVLRNGESQRSDGKYMFRYTDPRDMAGWQSCLLCCLVQGCGLEKRLA